MPSNDQIILDQIVEGQRLARFPSANKSDFFEIYVAEQALKDFDVSDEEIESGLVGGGGDGGIDAIYTFTNGDLVREDHDHESLKKNLLIEVIIISAKTSPTFDEDSMNKLIAVTNDLFDLARPVDDFKRVYNEGVRSAVDLFRQLYFKVANRFPRLHFRYISTLQGGTGGTFTPT